MRSALILCALVAAASGQLSATRNDKCGPNESFQTCGTACEPACNAPSATFCTLQCVVGCQCDPGFVRRADNACVRKEDCNVPLTAPPLPAPTSGAPSNMICGANEERNSCHNPCTEKKCSDPNAPMVSCLMVCMNGCSCKSGYVRNGKGVCVKEADCPVIKPTENQCNLVDCRTGTKCVIQNGAPACIPDCNTAKCSPKEECVLVQVTCVKAPCHPIAECRPKAPQSDGPSCMTARCGTPAGCAMIKPMSCAHDKNCKLQPACIHENACAATSCSVGTECVLHEVQCIRAPCNPIAQCEPIQRSGDSRCKKANETWAQCKTACSDTMCNQEPMMCPAVCRSGGCVCLPGFFRDKRGNCVTQNDYNSTSEITKCATVRCLSGTECQVLERNCAAPPCETYASCVNVTVVNNGGCATMLCRPGETCQEAMVKCAAAPCPKHAMCVMDTIQNDTMNSCASVTCPVGESCEETPVQCFVAPCQIIPKCIPNKTGVTCNLVTCPDKESCYDVARTGMKTTTLVSRSYCQNDTDATIATCDQVKCPAGKYCLENGVEGFALACVPETENFVYTTSCSSVRCPSGQRCEETEVACLMAPCPKSVSCISNQIAVSCDYVTCPGEESCAFASKRPHCQNDTDSSEATCAQVKCPDGHFCRPKVSGYEPIGCVFGDIPLVEESPASCAAVSCPVGESCVVQEVACSMAPCPKTISCVPHPTTQTTPNTTDTTTVFCDKVTCPDGDQCETEWFQGHPTLYCRDSYNRTILAKCDRVTCPDGEYCFDVGELKKYNFRMKCIPKPPRTPARCKNIVCPDGEECMETYMHGVVRYKCWSQTTSTEIDTCERVNCHKGQKCDVDENHYYQVDCVDDLDAVDNDPVDSTCPRNQTMSECLNTCSEAKCPGSGTSMMCTKHCSKGCACATGFVRSSDGECYKSKDCPPDQMCGQNEEYLCEKCAGTCENPSPNCLGPKNKNCQKTCICAAGFVKKNGKCVTLASCPDHDHSNITCLGTQDYTDCLPKCRQLCSGVQECDTNMQMEMCTPGCVCRANYKMDSNGDCVHNRHCFKTTDCPLNEEWSKCVLVENICKMATIQRAPLRYHCFSGCICSTGFARNSNGTCVEQDKC
ncbi:hypothetical protein CAEBREN_03418 [Caenorhabditis brenneri]|uniref:Follistatin-like domain-containing protein n=1 Tax=Caenorhabditis brenneri TaxID=135651 RepID=G0N6T3_CAEBE|nr:hypothetical protein CAEBREN_03418 [Caenorhabditis brenneri]